MASSGGTIVITEPALAPYIPYTLRSVKGEPLTHDEMDANFKEIVFLLLVSQLLDLDDIMSFMSKVNTPILLTEAMTDTYTGILEKQLVFKVPSGYSNVQFTQSSSWAGWYRADFYTLDRENVKCSTLSSSRHTEEDDIFYINEEDSYFIVLTLSLQSVASSLTVNISPTQYTPPS